MVSWNKHRQLDHLCVQRALPSDTGADSEYLQPECLEFSDIYGQAKAFTEHGLHLHCQFSGTAAAWQPTCISNGSRIPFPHVVYGKEQLKGFGAKIDFYTTAHHVLLYKHFLWLVTASAATISFDTAEGLFKRSRTTIEEVMELQLATQARAKLFPDFPYAGVNPLFNDLLGAVTHLAQKWAEELSDVLQTHLLESVAFARSARVQRSIR